MIKPIATLLTASILTACGGGGSGETSTTAATPEEQDTGIKTLTIDNPQTYFQHACLEPTMQSVIPVNINNDTYQDFIVHYWCSQETWEQENNEETPDAIVVHVSNSDGTYNVANDSVFGTDLVELGAASRKFARGDINGDGVDDFAFAMNREDGRSGANDVYVFAQPSMLLSNGQGKYSVERIGMPDWGHAVEIVTTSSGARHVLFSGYNKGTQSFEWTPTGFVDVSSRYPNSHGWVDASEAINRNGKTEYITASTSKVDSSNVRNHGIALAKEINGEWVTVSEYFFETEFEVDWTNWTGDSGYTMEVIDVNGTLYFNSRFYAICDVENYSVDGKSLIAGKLSTTRLISGETIQPGVAYSENETTSVNILTFFEYENEKLVPVESPIVNEVVDVNYNELNCKDVTGNGLTDIVVSPFTQPWNEHRVEEAGKPIVYANNGNNQFEKLDTSAVPGHSSKGFTHGSVHDIDGNGETDFVVHGANAGSDPVTGLDTGTIEIQLIPN